jgi:putative sterol carrier protein
MTNSRISAHELLTALPGYFKADQAEGVNAVIGISLPDSGEWHLHIHDGVCEVTATKPPHPDSTMTLHSTDFVALMEGALNPLLAVMNGKLKIGGNTALLTRMEKWFSL